jgi:endogenous inhibitor of DNA gyrase (YacG/DUF329 family)
VSGRLLRECVLVNGLDVGKMCRMSKHEPTQDHACKRCGAAFELNRNRYQIFCSYNCRNLWYLDVDKPPRISKKCAVCGREFQSTKNSPKISCSPACARERTYRIQRVNPSQRKGAEVECRSCGKRFVKYHQNALYCSPECQKTRGKINYAPRECVVCKGSFMPKRSDSMTCGIECQVKRNVRYILKKKALEHAALKAAFGFDEF